jgi:transposase
MEPYRPSLRRRIASAGEFLGKVLTMFKPKAEEYRSQRMCPFCGLITPRAKRVCLECGKSLSDVSLERNAEKHA